MQSSNKSERLFSATLLFLMIAFGIFLRVQNRDALEEPYLFGTDSYRCFRQTRQIVESGDLPRMDTMRNSPAGIDNTTVTPLFLPCVVTVLHILLELPPQKDNTLS